MRDPAPGRRAPEATPASLSFWTVAAILGLFLAAASAPSPLYVTYAVRWHFGPVTITSIFAVYALVLLAVLLTTGSLSDSIGRRPVIAAALGLQSLSMLLFLLAGGVIWLYAARALQGAATGLVTAAVAAALIDLQPPGRPTLGPLVNAVTPTIGLAVGALAAGALVQYAPAPLRLIYALLLAGFLLLAGATAWLPVAGAARKPVSLRPQLHLERTIRPAFWAVLPCLVATWAIGGLYLSLGPSLFLSLSQSGNRLLGGSIVFALCAAGALAGIAMRSWAPRRAMRTGCVLLLIGLAITITATAAANAALLFLGTIVAGAGFGSAFLGAFRSLAAQATPGGRAGLIATIYIAAYLAFSLPAIGAGVLTTQLGLRLTAIGYAAVVAALTGAALIATAPVSTGERPTPAGRMRRPAGKAHESPSEGVREQDSS